MTPGKTISYILALCGTLTCVATLHAAQDWPMHRGDASRSAYTSNELPTKLQLSWKRVPKHRPSPAWSAQPRLDYDRTYHPVCYDGLLFFGSSTDHKVYALDANTGTEVWTFFTGAPIRVAPAVREHGVYIGGDDGVLYCLDVKSGRLRWKIRAAPEDDRIMGKDRLISRWPIRGGPVIRDGVVYFAAGIWPTEGTHVYAVDAQSGDVIWKNDTCGSLISNKPRAGRDVKSGPAAQGHLAVGEGILVVPTGRAAPAVFDLNDGGSRILAAETKQSAADSEMAAVPAREILSKTGVTQGYCLDIGCEDGELAYQLATWSDLYVYGVDTDLKRVQVTRKRLDALGLYGKRVTIHHVSDLNDLPYGGRFAELIVSSRGLREGADFLSADVVRRMLCPHLGVACLGKAGSLKVEWRGAVEGAGDWTHFYADPHNSYCGTDTALKGPLELL